MEILKEKCKRLKLEIKRWNKKVYARDNNARQTLIVKIAVLDQCDDDGNLTEEKRIERVELLSQLRIMEEKEAAMIKKKVRVVWLINGDTNSKNFHSSLRWQRVKNEICGLRINGVWCEEPNRVKSHIKSFSECRFEATLGLNLNIDGVGFKTISGADNDILCSSISESEILVAVSQCGNSKCLRPDGYNFFFIKNNWDVIGKDIVRAILWFQDIGFIPRGCNASFIALVPKKVNPSNLNEFRPISLVGCVYKILSKVLANRLKKVLSSVIDFNQSAFLGGRGLLDSVLVANEMVDYLKKAKKSGVFVKVDFEKTYDSVDWKFVYYMMGRLGFNCKWIRWIRACLESATVSVLVNGSPTEEFKPKRGLRQGDSLTPFLFLIVVE